MKFCLLMSSDIQKLLDHAKQSAINATKTILRSNFKKAESTGDLIGRKTTDKITDVSKISKMSQECFRDYCN